MGTENYVLRNLLVKQALKSNFNMFVVRLESSAEAYEWGLWINKKYHMYGIVEDPVEKYLGLAQLK